MGKEMAFHVSDILDMDNNPEVKKAMEEWAIKKQKSLDKAEKRELRKRTYRKRR